ncbi:DUF3237 domain-containing protein [Gammaproteobacteria bacterium]|nr:DUF3237 domain-containing protein [Gammaproteobacteria bacterium]
MTISRRKAVGLLGTVSLLSSVSAIAQSQTTSSSTGPSAIESSEIYDPIGLELVMNINVICSQPESMGPEDNAADGTRDNLWPIVGGRFSGPNISGSVIPGGGDFPVVRPDGVTIIDALYRLKTDDDYQIIIHNKGLGYENGIFRLNPVFNVSGDKYSWLRESTFVANLIFPTPDAHKIPMGTDQNDRLIQVFRLT